MQTFKFTSESVAQGHPDKIADQISDAVLDACLEQDPHSRVACETLITDGLVVLAGEITTQAIIDFRAIVRNTIEEIGYNDSSLGFDAKSCGILFSMNKQSPDIARGIEKEKDREQGAGDQGMMFGFACDETPTLMPLPIAFAHEILAELNRCRRNGSIPYLGPDAKSQVTVEYGDNYTPHRLDTVVLSTQHSDEISQEEIHRDMLALIKRIAPKGMIDDQTIFYINPTGRFVIGGPRGDTGLTGRKIMVDSYGGMGRHGGGAFSGKDPSKVDRSGAYMARYVAKNIVAAKLAKRCEVEVSYAIGVAKPVSLLVNTFGTGSIPEEALLDAIPKVFDLTPHGMIKTLDLLRPIYFKTASGGHFGRSESTFSWEKTDCADKLRHVLNLKPEKITA